METQLHRRKRRIGLSGLCLLALIVGVVTGLGAVGLRALIGLIHNIAFLGEFRFAYDASVPTPPSPLGWLVIFVPVIGGAVVVFMVRRWAPEARGHGVPEVLDAIYLRAGHIRPVVVIVKSLASALSIGTGASVGREGPIIQIGSGIGSSLGQILSLQRWQTVTLVASGAGAGIAATFNTPLGAVMFVVELMLPEVSARTFLPVVIATSAATYVGRIFFGVDPAFMVPLEAVSELLFPQQMTFLPVYALFGVLCGIAAAAFIQSIERMDDVFAAMPGNDYTRNATGMLALGILFYVMLLTTGNYHVEGVGYATIQSILNGGIDVAWLLAVLFVAKLLATSLSLGAGASGGIFSPALFLGATLGGGFGALAGQLWPNLAISPVAFAIIGMAALVGGSTGAAMTGILLIFEMTLDYSVVLPSVVTVATAIGVRRLLSRESIYSAKLARRGTHIPEERHAHMFLTRCARDIMAPVAGTTARGLAPAMAAAGRPDTATAGAWSVMLDGNRVTGIVPRDAAAAGARAAQPVSRFTIVRGEDFLQAVMQRMERRNCKVALVLDKPGRPRAGNIVGVITHEQIAAAIIADVAR